MDCYRITDNNPFVVANNVFFYNNILFTICADKNNELMCKCVKWYPVITHTNECLEGMKLSIDIDSIT